MAIAPKHAAIVIPKMIPAVAEAAILPILKPIAIPFRRPIFVELDTLKMGLGFSILFTS